MRITEKAMPLEMDFVQHICKQKGCKAYTVGRPDMVYFCTNHKWFVEMVPIGASNARIRAKAYERLNVEMDCS